MTTKPDGGPAFPVAIPDMRLEYGMTLRQWYAGMAMQGLMATSDQYFGRDFNLLANGIPDISTLAYRMADALIAEGEK